MVFDIVEFKSSNKYFTDEKLGIKNNTVREFDLTDKRFHILIEAWKTGKYPYIMILGECFYEGMGKATFNEPTKPDSFLRKIVHIALWKDLMIITWEHKE